MLRFEPFGQRPLIEQAQIMTDLVAASSDFLEQTRKVTLENYASDSASLASLRRLDQANTLNGGLLRSDDTAIGVGTIVSDLVITHPDKKRQFLRGDQIDLWTIDGVSQKDHEMLVQVLLGQCTARRKLAILSHEEAQRARGIPALMHAVGFPGPVSVPFWRAGKDYGLPAVAEPLQVYTFRT